MNAPQNIALTRLRDPTRGRISFKLPFPRSCAGPLYRVHYDQYEKLWTEGMMIYAGRCRTGYVTSCVVLRNKHSESIKLACVYGIDHCRGFVPFSSEFDKGSEPAEFQQYLRDLGMPDRNIKRTSSKDNSVIESFWRWLFETTIWIYKVEMNHLKYLALLDPYNPIHLACVWSSYAHDVQDSVDENVSDVFNHRKMYKYLLFVVFCSL